MGDEFWKNLLIGRLPPLTIAGMCYFFGNSVIVSNNTMGERLIYLGMIISFLFFIFWMFDFYYKNIIVEKQKTIEDKNTQITQNLTNHQSTIRDIIVVNKELRKSVEEMRKGATSRFTGKSIREPSDYEDLAEQATETKS